MKKVFLSVVALFLTGSALFASKVVKENCCTKGSACCTAPAPCCNAK